MKVEITRLKSGKMYYEVYLFHNHRWLTKGYNNTPQKELIEDILLFIQQYRQNIGRWIYTNEKYPKATTYTFTLLS